MHTRVALAIAVMAVLSMAPPTATRAYACIWEAAHAGSPLPPCPSDDLALIRRINDLNVQLLGKVMTVASTIMEVRQEIRQWEQSWMQARRWSERYQREFARLTANPLPSLIAQYNRSAPLGKYLQLSANGTWVVTLEPIDFREIAQEFLADLTEHAVLAEHYFWGIPGELSDQLESESAWIRQNMSKRVEEVLEREAYIEETADMLRETGDALAERYADWSDGGGHAEARISRLSALLSRVRGTAFDAEMRALQARMQAIHAAHHQGNRVRRHQQERMWGTW